MTPADQAKIAAANHAASYVKNGMRVGLGTGSTAAFLVKRLGERVRDEGLQFIGVPTSTRTADLARDVGVQITTLDQAKWLNLTIDGADEVDPNLNLIKGGGGALFQEKIVAAASDRMIVITDASKHVGVLGAFPLPVEVTPFGMGITQTLIEETLSGHDVQGLRAKLRMAGDAPFVTDEGNHIIDLHLGRIGDARKLAVALNMIPGVVETGLFIDICDLVITGYEDGRVETMTLDEDMTGDTGPHPDNIFTDTME